MSVLPSTSFLGKLEIVEIYEYYDKPVLFACRNAAKTTFLVVLVDESEQSATWYYVALSQDRFNQVRTGVIDLHQAFKAAEDEIVYEVMTFSDDYPSQFRILPTSVLTTSNLPEVGAFLDEAPSDEHHPATG